MAPTTSTASNKQVKLKAYSFQYNLSHLTPITPLALASRQQRPAINQLIKKIYEDYELETISTIQKFRIVQNEGSRQVSREVTHYNLQMSY